jgi:hypothetical protein
LGAPKTPKSGSGGSGGNAKAAEVTDQGGVIVEGKLGLDMVVVGVGQLNAGCIDCVGFLCEKDKMCERKCKRRMVKLGGNTATNGNYGRSVWHGDIFCTKNMHRMGTSALRILF